MIRNRGSLKRRGRRRDLGQAMIEFSLVMSFLLVPIVMGVAGFAAYLGNFIALTDAVSYGARELSMSRGAMGVTDPCLLVKNVVTNAYKAAAIESATPTLTVALTVMVPGPGGTVTTYGPNSSGNCTSYLNYLVIGGTVKVNVTHTTQSIFGTFGSFTIAAQTQELVQ